MTAVVALVVPSHFRPRREIARDHLSRSFRDDSFVVRIASVNSDSLMDSSVRKSAPGSADYRTLPPSRASRNHAIRRPC